jgi:uncharacterized protein (DUF305 family)
MRKSLMLLALPLLVALMAGCSKAPVVEENNAVQAVSGAEQAQAAKYAPTEWRTVQDTLEAAKAEKAKQDSRFALFRSYGKAKALYEKVPELAASAKTKAEAELARVRQETQTLIAQARAELDSAGAMLSTAPVGKDNKADIEMMKQDVAASQQTLTDAQGDFDRGNYDGAKAKAQTIIDKSKSIKTAVEAAIAKKGGRRAVKK